MRDRPAPTVSVVVPTYGRRPDLFRAAIESVREQTIEEERVELVVVDDSPDAVSSWIDDSLAGVGAVHCLRGGDHEGAGAARNAGIEAASGEFLAFLDDDDEWLPRKLERQLAICTSSDESDENDESDLGVVHTRLRHVDSDGTKRTGGSKATGDVTRAILEGAFVGIFSCLLVRASTIEVAGRIDPRLPYLEDREWCLRLSQYCEFGGVDEPLVRYRHGDHEQLTDDFEALRDVAYPLFLEKHRSLADSYGRRCRRRFEASLARTVVTCGLQQGRYGDARRFALRALRVDPTNPTNYAYFVAALGGGRTHSLARQVKRAAGR